MTLQFYKFDWLSPDYFGLEYMEFGILKNNFDE
jgi:hypothetical protein